MTFKLNKLIAALVMGVINVPVLAGPFSGNTIKIGVLGDMSGMYAGGYSGTGAVDAVKMAVEDFGGKVNGVPIEVISADHQNKPDLASSIAREWIDQQGVDMITNINMSAVSLAVQGLASSKKTITMITSAGAPQTTGEQCTKYGIQYGFNSDSEAIGVIGGLSDEGLKTWYFITVDYVYGKGLQNIATRLIEESGGKVLGSTLQPLGTSDFSSFMLKAQASKAQVVGLANAGMDTVNAVKSAHEFRLTHGGQKLATFAMLLNDVKALGLPTAQGLFFPVGWYWDMDKESREWTARYLKKSNGAAPTFPRAAMYSATMAYLNAVKAVDTDNPDKVRAQLGKMKINDFFAKGGVIRSNGLLAHDMYLLQVKKPGESHSEWDLAKVVNTIPADVAYPTVLDAACKL